VRLGRSRSDRRLIRDPGPYFELSGELFAAADPEGYFVSVTPVWERVLGHGVDDLVGRPVVEFVHPDDFAHTRGELERAAASDEGGVVFEGRFRAADGEYVWLEWRAIRSADDGLIHAAARDLSERRRLAEELNRAIEHSEQASRAKSDFLSRMSHELRTPLTSVIGFSELLLRDGLDEGQVLKLEQILKAGEHLVGLIDELLDIERVEAGTMTASPEPIQVGGLLRDALALAGPQAAERDLRVDSELEACRDKYVMADPQRLRQAVLNLLSNAIKYNRPGGEVRLGTEVTDDETLRIHVSDTGAGLSDEQLRRLFVPFDRLGAEESGVEGAGLGLVLSQRLVELMGGRLRATSEIGVGSTFTIELGMTDAEEAMTREPVPAEGSNGHGSLAGRRVLYIEDNMANLDLVTELLGSSGATVMTARDGRSGFGLARRQRPDLILLDLNLPDLGGEQVLSALDGDERLRDIPVIAISADASRGTKLEMYGRGIAAYITKPFDSDSLLGSVEQALSRGRG
jgi:PAS domain S-box-containing protein